MSHALLCFGSTFLAVFTLGLQSLNVNQGNYLAAAVTSLGIGVGHIALYKYMPGADLVDVAAYLAGGVIGIVSSMWFHRVAKEWWKDRQSRKPAGRIKPPMPWPAPAAPGAWVRSHDFEAALNRPELCQICNHPKAEHVYLARRAGYVGDIH